MKLTAYLKRNSLAFVALTLLLFVPYQVGGMLAESPAESAARIKAHNAHVVAAVEAGAPRYSRFYDGDQNLLLDWQQEPRVPMMAFDHYYRTGDDSEIRIYRK